MSTRLTEAERGSSPWRRTDDEQLADAGTAGNPCRSGNISNYPSTGIEPPSARFQVRVQTDEHFEEKDRGSLKSETFQTASWTGDDDLVFRTTQGLIQVQTSLRLCFV
jgi:hypothetical protein